MARDVSFQDPYASDYAEIARQRKLAEILGQQAAEPLGNTEIVSGWAIPQSKLAGLNKVAQGALSAFGQYKANEREKLLAEKVREGGKKDATDFMAALQGTPEQLKPVAEGLEGPPQMVAPAVAGDKQKALAIALGSGNPMVQGAGSAMLADMLKDKKPIVLGKTLVDPDTYQPVAVDQTWQADQQAARAQKIEELNMRLQDQRLNREEQATLRRELAANQEAMRRDLAAQASADRRMIAAQSSADRRVAVAQGNKPPSGYRYTPDGNLEMIPGGPADMKRQTQIEGGGTVDTVVADLRDMYNQLDEKGGITSTKKRWGSNLAAGVQSSGLGQAAGKLFGTESQSLRNTVAQKRPLLLQAIMKATGMTAKQMDSNTELKLYLSTATDPQLDLETNKRALDMIEKLYGSGAGNAPIAPDGGAPTAPAGAGNGGWSIRKK